MKINHVAMYVCDLEKMRSFYEMYFGGRAGALYHNPKTGLRTYFLSFADGGRLEIMTRPELQSKPKQPVEAGYIHLAFSAGSRQAVDDLTARLRGDGYTVLSGPRTTGDGYYESCVADPEGNQVEIVE